MITRAEYMEINSERHHEYYAQFVTEQTLSFVRNVIGVEKLKASDDPDFNDVVRWEQGGRTWAWDRTPINSTLAKECGEGLSMSTRTCVGKAAARIILGADV